MKGKRDYCAVPTILLLMIVSIVGIMSLNFNHAYDVTNQFGQTVKMFGSGVYARDTYLQGTISIGTDFVVLLVCVPLFLYTYVHYRRKGDAGSRLKLISMYGVSFYYATSLSMGLAFNQLFLCYVALFSFSLFGLFRHLNELKLNQTVLVSKGVNIFLVITGLALFLAWLPDVIPALIHGTTLSIIGIYTTCITYVIDMGIISPLCFLCIYLLGKKNELGTVILAVMLKLCIIVGIMMITQTICQYASGCDLPLGAMITKSLSFVLLGGFAMYFNQKLFKQFG